MRGGGWCICGSLARPELGPPGPTANASALRASALACTVRGSLARPELGPPGPTANASALRASALACTVLLASFATPACSAAGASPVGGGAHAGEQARRSEGGQG